MPEKFNQYYLTETLSKKYSHVTYLASPRDEPEHQLVLTVFSSFLFHFPYERESFLQKAHRVKQLQHEHVFSIHEMGIEEEQPFVVREYLPDGSLRRWLKQLSPDRLPLRDALSILLQVGEALVYAHQQNIVHGAIKPENIFLDGNGQVLVTDFNLVSRKDACIRDQASEEYAFCYLAPEQFAGLTDARSDQYALGCLAYELITGQVPFAAQSLVSMMGQARNDQPAPLSESVAALPATLDAAVLKTLAKDPTERFFDFSLFLEVIQSVLSPPPAFPLKHAETSSKKRTIFHLVHSEKAKNIPSSIQEHNISAAFASQPSQLSTSEIELEGQTSQWTKSVLLTKEKTDEALFIDLSTEEDDVLLTNTFEEAVEPSQVTATVSSVFEQHELEREEMSQSLASPSRQSQLLTKRTQRDRRKPLAVILIMLVVIIPIAYAAAFSPLRILEPEGTSYPTQDARDELIPHREGVLPTQSSGQMTSLPLVQPSVQANGTSIAAHASGTAIAQPSAHAKGVSTTQSPSTEPASASPTATPAPTPADSPIAYEAEASQNTLAGGAQVVSCSTCSGGARVEQIGRGGTLQFNNVSKNNASSYSLTIYYTNGSGDRVLYMSVNGGSAVTITVSATGTWHTVGTTSVTVSLNAGDNTILFSNSSDRGPDIDRIVV